MIIQIDLDDGVNYKKNIRDLLGLIAAQINWASTRITNPADRDWYESTTRKLTELEWSFKV